jgi:hypothetical protein
MDGPIDETSGEVEGEGFGRSSGGFRIKDIFDDVYCR